MKKIIFTYVLFLTSSFFAQDTTSLPSSLVFNKKSIDFSLGFIKIGTDQGGKLPQPISLNLGYRKMSNNVFGQSFNLEYNLFSNLNIPFAFPTKLATTNNINLRYQFVSSLSNVLSFNEFTTKFGLLVHAGPGLGIMMRNGSKTETVFSFSTGITPQFKLKNNMSFFIDLTSNSNIFQDFKFYGNTKALSKVNNYLNFNLGLNYYGVGLDKDKTHADWTAKGSELKKKIAELKVKIASTEAKLQDTDQDGIANYLDQELETPAGSIVNSKGQSVVDMDGDGILDVEDYCPTVKGTLEFKGCPTGMTASKSVEEDDVMDVPTELAEKLAKYGQDVKFDLNSSVIKNNMKKDINKLAESLISFPNFNLLLAGHSDNIGEEAVNLEVSAARAEAIRDYLVSKGINASRIKTKGYGYTKPKDSNDTEKGRANNRRVEFKIKK
jgi:OOP family OmpA-OmpF porin